MIFLDLDGVLADFVSAARDVHRYHDPANVPADYVAAKWDFFTDWGITGKTFWSHIHAKGLDFYGSWVQPYSWALTILREVDRGHDDFAVLTAPSSSHWSYAGKKLWVDTYLRPACRRPIKLIVANMPHGEDTKHLLAGPDRLLIDDNDENVGEFRRAGGHAVVFPQLWNSRADLVPTFSAENWIRDLLKNWEDRNMPFLPC